MAVSRLCLVQTICLPHDQPLDRNKTIFCLKFVTGDWFVVGMPPGSGVPNVEVCPCVGALVFRRVGAQVLQKSGVQARMSVREAIP